MELIDSEGELQNLDAYEEVSPSKWSRVMNQGSTWGPWGRPWDGVGQKVSKVAETSTLSGWNKDILPKGSLDPQFARF